MRVCVNTYTDGDVKEGRRKKVGEEKRREIEAAKRERRRRRKERRKKIREKVADSIGGNEFKMAARGSVPG